MADGVEFEEEGMAGEKYRQAMRPAGVANTTALSRLQVSREARGITAWLISHKLAKNFESAQRLLLIIVVVNIIITITVALIFL